MLRNISWMLPLLVVATVLFGNIISTDAGQFVKLKFKDEHGEHTYQVYQPTGYGTKVQGTTTPKKWPVVLFLHGAGERGNDGEKQTKIGLGPFLEKQLIDPPCLVVFPQCDNVHGSATGGWLATSLCGQRALKIMDEVIANMQGDPQQQVLTGWSMGGFGTWSLAAAEPTRWSAVMPLSGGGDITMADKFKAVPLWAIHGARDSLVRAKLSSDMISAIRSAGGRPLQTILEFGDHDIWLDVYGSPLVWDFLLHKKTDWPDENVVLNTARPTNLSRYGTLPFVPAAKIENAGQIHLGPQLLKSWADAYSSKPENKVLSAAIPNINMTTQAMGRPVQVTLGNISYSANVARVVLTPLPNGNLSVSIGVQNANILIGGTSMNSGRKHAVAGTTSIRFAQHAPVWLTMNVIPKVVNGKMQFTSAGASFNIPPNDYYVTPPASAWINGMGIFVDEQDVSQGLTTGLYGQRGRIEQEVRNIAPTIVKQIEQQFSLNVGDKLGDTAWPLPVYPPRLHVEPSYVAVNGDGVDLNFNMIAGAINPYQESPKPLQMFKLDGPINPLKADWLSLSLHESILEKLTTLVVDSGMNRIDVKDLPIHGFNVYTNPDKLHEMLGSDFKISAQPLQAELVMNSPIVAHTTDGMSPPMAKVTAKQVKKTAETQLVSLENDTPGDKAADSKSDDATADQKADQKAETESTITSAPLNLSTDNIQIEILQSNSEGKSTQVALVEYSLVQPIVIEQVQPKFGKLQVRTIWQNTPDIKLQKVTLNGADKIADLSLDQQQKLIQTFQNAWQQWTDSQSQSAQQVSTIQAGTSPLTLEKIVLQDHQFQAQMQPPQIRIINEAETPFSYQVRSEYSNWSEIIILPPGDSQFFRVATPIKYQSLQTGFTEHYTLYPNQSYTVRAKDGGRTLRLFME
jgi:predicted esterase